MDEPRKALASESEAKVDKAAAVLPPAENGQPVSTYISRVNPARLNGDGNETSSLQDLAFAKGLGKILAFYATLVTKDGDEPRKNIMFHGNVVINKNHHGIDVSTRTLQVPIEAKDILAFEIDMDRILVDFKEFALMMDDFFDYLRLNVPSIVFLHNADAFLSRSFKVKESSSAASFIIRFTKFIVERIVQRDKIILVIVVDNPRVMEKRFSNTVDFTIDVDLPSPEERTVYLKHLLHPDAAVDFTLASSEMNGWTWGDIEAFTKHALLQKQSKGLKEISAKFLLDAIHGENDLDGFTLPSARLVSVPGRGKEDDEERRATGNTTTWASGSGGQLTRPFLTSTPLNQATEDPFKEMLWEEAADREYDTVARVLDHMDKGVFLQEDRTCLARYPFLLHDDILTAKRKLDAAKNKIDLIKKHFKGK
jgi:hypothetical protein